MKSIEYLIQQKKIDKITDVISLGRRVATLVFIHRASNRIFSTLSRNIKGYIQSFQSKCVETKEDNKSEFFSIFLKSTHRDDWDIYSISGPRLEANPLVLEIQTALKAKPFLKILRCASSDVEANMYTLYKVSCSNSSIVRWFISMQEHDDAAAVEKAKFGLSGMSYSVNKSPAFRQQRMNFMCGRNFKVVRYVDHPILKTVRPSLYAKISNKLNVGDLTIP